MAFTKVVVLKIFKSISSIAELWDGYAMAARRFPFALLAAVLGCTLVTALICNSETHFYQEEELQKCLLTSLLAIPLFIACRAAAIRSPLSTTLRYALIAAVLIFLLVYTLATPADEVESLKMVTRFLGLNLAFHLLVSFAPFFHVSDKMQFWEYNKTLFVHAVIGVIYVVATGIGLMLAYLALEKLFGIDIDEKVYGLTWVWLVGFVFTVYFLRHFPRWEDIRADSIEMPSSLSVFLRYIMIPLVVLYFIILYAYSGKILIEFSWPKGWVSRLILGFSTVGILAWLLSYPKHAISEESAPRGRLFRVFGRNFFYILLPMGIVLILALQRRIGEYGFTEARYFACGLAAWLILTTGYMVFVKRPNILFLPASLSVFAILSVLGPTNAYQVSFSSQWNRMHAVFTKYDMLNGNRLLPGKDISDQDAAVMLAGLNYLFDFDHEEALIPLLDTAQLDRWSSNAVRKYLNISQVKGDQNEMILSVSRDQAVPVRVAGYDQMLSFYVSEGNERLVPETYVRKQGDRLLITSALAPKTQLPLQSLRTILDSAEGAPSDQQLPGDKLSIEWVEQAHQYKLIWNHLTLIESDSIKLGGDGWLLFRSTTDVD